MIELLSLIGSAGAGKAFGLISDWQSARHHEKEEAADREFQKWIAEKGQLNEYIQAVHGSGGSKPSPLSLTLCAIYLMFTFTACAACLYCFYVGFGEVLIKDPDQQQSSFRFFLLETKWSPKGVIQLSPMGLGYLILHPILFVLSMVSTGTRVKR